MPGVDQYAYTLDAFGDLTTSALEIRLGELGEKPFRAGGFVASPLAREAGI